MRAFRSMLLAAALVIATSAANAAVRVFVNVGPSGYPVYAQSYGPSAYYSYGQYYPGRWDARRDWSEHEWRGQEYREHRDHDRDHRDRDRHDRDGYRHHDDERR